MPPFPWDFSTSPRQTLYSYEAWGQRRDAADWLGSADSQTTYTWGGGHDVTPRGFTGHEQLDDLGLIHMNGRIYDPLLGRFLSADLLVQNPGSVQSYNRYSYVFNNPLRYTDPSGYTGKQQVADSGDTNTAEHVRAVRRFRVHEPLFTDLLFDNGALAAELANQASEQADPSAPATQTVDQEAPTTGSDQGQVAEDKPAGESGSLEDGKRTEVFGYREVDSSKEILVFLDGDHQIKLTMEVRLYGLTPSGELDQDLLDLATFLPGAPRSAADLAQHVAEGAVMAFVFTPDFEDHYQHWERYDGVAFSYILPRDTKLVSYFEFKGYLLLSKPVVFIEAMPAGGRYVKVDKVTIISGASIYGK